MSPRKTWKSEAPRTCEWDLIWKWGLCRQNALSRKPGRWDLIQMSQRQDIRAEDCGHHHSSRGARLMVPGSVSQHSHHEVWERSRFKHRSDGPTVLPPGRLSWRYYWGHAPSGGSREESGPHHVCFTLTCYSPCACLSPPGPLYQDTSAPPPRMTSPYAFGPAWTLFPNKVIVGETQSLSQRFQKQSVTPWTP